MLCTVQENWPNCNTYRRLTTHPSSRPIPTSNTTKDAMMMYIHTAISQNTQWLYKSTYRWHDIFNTDWDITQNVNANYVCTFIFERILFVLTCNKTTSKSSSSSSPSASSTSISTNININSNENKNDEDGSNVDSLPFTLDYNECFFIIQFLYLSFLASFLKYVYSSSVNKIFVISYPHCAAITHFHYI